jgi:hypothetical protein
MNVRNGLLVVFIVCSIFLSDGAQGKNLIKTLSLPVSAPVLEKGQGYLLVYINVNGSAPSIELSKVNTKKTDFLVTEPSSFTRDYTLDLKNITPGFYVVPMLAGIYQITRVNAPFYDLPYWLATEKQAKWRFGIEENHVNFIGEIYIAKERGTNTIDVNLLNRFATYRKQILNELLTMPVKLPLVIKPGYQDEFLRALEK